MEILGTKVPNSHAMKFSAFLKSLIPGFEKDNVLEDVRLTRTELKEITIPAFETSISLLAGKELKSKEIENFDKIFRRNNPGFPRELFEGMLEGLHIAEANMDVVEDLISRTYNEDVAASGLTYLKANLLQFVEVASFVSKYARRFLFYTFVLESAEYEANSLKASESLSKAEIRWIEDNMLTFAQAFKIVATPKAKLAKQFADVPDIVITGDNEDHLMHTTSAKIDPLQMRFIPAWLNIIYHVRLGIAEWQVGRYNAAKEELKVIQLRKLHLERLRAGKADAAIEKEIAYLEERAQKLNYKLRQMEEEAARA